jgi:hypothetical protein
MIRDRLITLGALLTFGKKNADGVGTGGTFELVNIRQGPGASPREPQGGSGLSLGDLELGVFESDRRILDGLLIITGVRPIRASHHPPPHEKRSATLTSEIKRPDNHSDVTASRRVRECRTG